MTGAGNNTYLLASAGAAVLIDSGVGHPDHLEALERALSESHASLQSVLVTHGHADHVSGVPAIAIAHPKTTFAKHVWQGDEPIHGVKWMSLDDGQEVRFGESSVTVIHTPGHSPDHVAFWHQPTRAAYTGDLLIAGSSVVIEASRGGDLNEYLASLRRILELGPARLFPAHGPRIDDPTGLVRAYIDHRKNRERQVIEAIRAGHLTVEAIAESIYDGLEPRLMAAARENVRAHLNKLAADRIAVDRDGWRLL
jgi:glyoxylase-like metal-dependent hydrolase (beta-lactamase superfamily II)